ncbi:hypothetical protein [Caldifermentibacillus hisashii]|uniref:hypothetical protein n=1 Tax=Caldifermentibacillus hisashii TaxID=996558 RepID=UPI001C110638|nr:hypothetical protein [Caldifermentibacillus hisashii]MBU5341301.1 hypothetical protein [Caldifermentibacillus hisashii]
MLTQADIEFIKSNRGELTANRTSKINVKYSDVTERDPFTGEPIGESEVTRQVDAVVTEISTGVDRDLDGGIVVQTGDLTVSISLEQIADIADKITAILYDGKDYEILAIDKKGIGADNRYEIIARLIS